tara:strand:- start:723 stop:1238 length:516 start_codon:yes stop_codon:yes gene_type:complete
VVIVMGWEDILKVQILDTSTGLSSINEPMIDEDKEKCCLKAYENFVTLLCFYATKDENNIGYIKSRLSGTDEDWDNYINHIIQGSRATLDVLAEDMGIGIIDGEKLCTNSNAPNFDANLCDKLEQVMEDAKEYFWGVFDKFQNNTVPGATAYDIFDIIKIIFKEWEDCENA